MFITKRRFFKRKNRYTLYNKFKSDFIKLQDISNDYLEYVRILDQYISKYKSEAYIHNYLKQLREESVNFSTVEIAFLSRNHECSNIVNGAKEYSNVTYFIKNLSMNIGKIQGALILLQRMEKFGLCLADNIESS